MAHLEDAGDTNMVSEEHHQGDASAVGTGSTLTATEALSQPTQPSSTHAHETGGDISMDLGHDASAQSQPDGENHPEPPAEYPNYDFEYQDADMTLGVDSRETDSAFEDLPESSTVSVSSSLYEPVLEYGRSYHRYRSGKYMLPNDETEQARLDLQHNQFLMALHGKLHLAPIKEGLHNVLDIATGTGIWAIDFAIKYPSAIVIGTDLSPIQPHYLPPNCSFEVADAEDEWLYHHQFDYIHGRMLVSCFQSFPPIVAKVFNALLPGGYFELQDICPLACLDDSWEGTELQRWNTLVVQAAGVLGMDWEKAYKYKQNLVDAGFEDVHEVQLAFASNTWPRGKHHKLIGALYNKNFLEGLQGFTMRVLNKGLGMGIEEVEQLLARVKEDICDKRLHVYAPVRIIYGRKPMTA